MKILHVINTLSAGGAELHLLTLCRAQRRRGLEPMVAFLRELVPHSRSLRAEFESAGIPTRDLAAPSGFDPSFVSRLTALARLERPRLLHTHLPRADVGGAIAGALSGIPVVASVHHDYGDKRRHRAVGPLLRWSYRRAAGVVAISESLRDWLLSVVAARPERVSTVHYGIEAAPFGNPGDVCVRQGWALSGRPVIGSLGRLEQRKGFETLIRAVAILREEFPDVALVIGGHDPDGYAPRLQKLAADLGLAESVRLIGFVTDTPSFLHAIDVFSFASCSEGFGQVTVEAMAARRPVVVSGVPPMTEIVKDGESGLLAAPASPTSFADAIARLLREPAYAAVLGEAAAQRIHRHFDVDSMVDRTIDVYRQVLAAEAQ